MQGQMMDAVTCYLKKSGMKPEPAYFESSSFMIGWRIQVNDLELVYRLDEDCLIICDLVSLRESSGSSDAVSTFIHLIHQMERSGVQVREVRGMFVKTLSNPEINRMRERLAAVLEAQGAYWQEIDGDSWLVYSLERARRRPALDLRSAASLRV